MGAARAPLRPTPGTAPHRHGARRRAAHRRRDPRDRRARRPHAGRRADRRTRPRRRGRAGPAGPVRVGPGARGRVRPPRRDRHQPPALHALAGRGGRERGARRRAGARRSRPPRARPASTPTRSRALVFLESAGREDAVAPSGIEGAVGLTQILAGTATDLLDMRVDTAAQRAAHAADRPRAARGHAGRGRAAAARAGARRRALRRRQGAGGHGPLPQARPRHARPRGPRVRLLPHGHRQPAGGAARVRRRYTWLGRRSTSTRRSPATPRPTAGCSSSATTPRTTTGRCSRRREIMRLYRDDRAELDRLTALHGAKGSAEEVLHPPGSVPQFADPGAAARRVGRRRDRGVPRHAEAARACGATRAWASSPRALDQPAGALPRSPSRGAGDGALHRRAGACAQRRVPAGGHLDGARRALPARAGQGATARRPGTSRCTRRAGRSTSSAATLSRRQALAFQYVLDRLPVLGGIAWVREPDAIHVTVSSEAKALLPLLDRIKPSP